MTQRILLSFLLVFVCGIAFADTPTEFDLKFERLQPAIDTLSVAEREAVADAISLIKRGENVLALSRLSGLKQRRPNNSSVRILASYALLQVGNLLGAFEEAEKAHDAPDGNSYKCWFLAKIALMNGKSAICERELDHVHSAGDMVGEARELEEELKRN